MLSGGCSRRLDGDAENSNLRLDVSVQDIRWNADDDVEVTGVDFSTLP